MIKYNIGDNVKLKTSKNNKDNNYKVIHVFDYPLRYEIISNMNNGTWAIIPWYEIEGIITA